MAIIKIEDVQLIQQQAKESKMEKIFSENETELTMLNKHILFAAKNDKSDFWYELDSTSPVNIYDLEEYYLLGGFYAEVDYDEYSLTIQW